MCAQIAVFPVFHGNGVATALLAAAATLELQGRKTGATLSLDVRAANVPAIKLYERLGFAFGENTFPGFLDCMHAAAKRLPCPSLLTIRCDICLSSTAGDGGFEGEADARKVAAALPENADISALGRAK